MYRNTGIRTRKNTLTNKNVYALLCYANIISITSNLNNTLMNHNDEQQAQYRNLSVKDLLEARDLFHVHLMNKANVVGTAIGRFRIRNEDIAEDGSIIKRGPGYVHKYKRTLATSQVIAQSYPCILVFVSEWKKKSDFNNGRDYSKAVPPVIYIPDGRIVPICVVEAPTEEMTDPNVDEGELVFPGSAFGGGYPLIIESQGIRKVASVGCIVTNGSKYYALTNRHVTDNAGADVYSKLKNTDKKIGTSTNINIGNAKFEATYSDWAQSNLFLNVDVGLIEIDDINQWKTDIFGLGRVGKVIDLSTNNMTLKLIGQEVFAHGAVSGLMQGEIAALFYRYKSIAGYEYVSDLLIGPAVGAKAMETRHGDSGTVWTIREENEKDGEVEYRPLAIQWGQRTVASADTSVGSSYALATILSHVCRALDVDIVRDWNLDLDFTWGKTGHFKVGYAACDNVSDQKLKDLLTANASNIGISDDDLIKGKVPPGLYSASFVPLTDVADMYWRNTRPADESNHFADMDAKHPNVYSNKSLLDLCFTKLGKINDTWVDVSKWLDFYQKMDVIDPEHDRSGKPRPRLGGLPFRVWQVYNEMVDILKSADPDATKLAKFVTAGGTLSHYVGDACQPLHISYLHDGYPDGTGKGVHKVYETKMLDTYKKKKDADFLPGITALLDNNKVKKSELFKGGKNAAKKVLSLMWVTYDLIHPKDIVDTYISKHSQKLLWDTFGDRTKQTIANGVHTMAVIWQSAWVEGHGTKIKLPAKKLTHTELMKWYKLKTFVESYKLSDPDLKPLLV